MDQKGLAPIIVLFIVGIILAGAVSVSYQKKSKNQPIIQNSQEASSSAAPQQTIAITPRPVKTFSQQATKAPTSTSKPTIAPSPAASATSTNNSTPSNPYDLNSATGAVKVIVKPQSGDLAYTPSAELSTVSGFKVLDGRSTDKITQFGPNRTDNLRGEIVFSTVPSGPYKVRMSYNGSWSDQKDVTVSSAKLSTVEFTVAGVVPTPTPTPTPVPKTVCQVNIASKSSEKAPATVNLVAGANIVKPPNLADKYITAVQWDYDGDGSWDTEMSASLAVIVSKEYTQPGTYTVKAKVQLSDGEVTDTCSNSFNLQ